MGCLVFGTCGRQREEEFWADLTEPSMTLIGGCCVVEIQAGADRQRVGGRQTWGRSTGKAETGLRNTVQQRVSVGEQCDWICAFKRLFHTEDAWSQ